MADQRGLKASKAHMEQMPGDENKRLRNQKEED
jgi:hypothetical protein